MILELLIVAVESCEVHTYDLWFSGIKCAIRIMFNNSAVNQQNRPHPKETETDLPEEKASILGVDSRA
jgi:hypothetical protein